MRITLKEIRSNHELQVINKKEKEAYRASTGRMLLACMDINEQKDFIAKYGLPAPDIWPDIKDEVDLILELNKIRNEQVVEQVSKARIVGVAVPIYKEKKVIASLGIYLPETRYTPLSQKRIYKSLQNYRDIINRKLNNSKENCKK